MVWFQCEDCGENLKKPKLAMHFNRCSAYKLSCIDCGVVFDQQSVQAHSSCVSEAEKYGPKGLNKGATGPASKARNSKVQNGSDVDFSRGLSTFPPWSCSLCNVKATSQETLELHAQGKKHQSRSKAAAAKEKKEAQGGETGVSAELNNGPTSDDVKGLETNEIQATVPLGASSLSAERKRKKERIGEEDKDLTSLPSGHLEKKLKRESSAVVRSASTSEEAERLTEAANDSQDKKRKLAEERQEIMPEESGQVAGKKSRKKGKLAPGEESGHRKGATEVSGTSAVAKDENGEQVKKKEKKAPLILGNGFYTGNKLQTSPEVDIRRSSDTPGKVQQDDIGKVSKKEKKKKYELKEALVHEISFREWLGEEDGTQAGTPTHPSHNITRGKGNLEQLEGLKKTKQAGKAKTDSTQDGIAKVVKWKKVIREVLGKSLNGKLKTKDLKRAVLPLAQKAMESASISVDRKALKAELMRQVTSSPKFVVDGKHVMLGPEV